MTNETKEKIEILSDVPATIKREIVVNKEMQTFVDYVRELFGSVEAVEITNEAQLEDFDALRKKVIKAKRDLIECQKATTKPILDLKNEIYGEFNKMIAVCAEAEALMNHAYAVYIREQNRIAQERQDEIDALAAEEQRKAEKEADEEKKRLEKLATAAASRGNMGLAQQHSDAAANVQVEEVMPATAIAQPQTKIKGTSIKENWEFEVTDISKVPAKYLIVDVKKIAKVVKALKGECEIEGIRVFRGKDTVSTRL